MKTVQHLGFLMDQNRLDVISVFEQGVPLGAPQFLSDVSWFGDVSE